MARPNVQFKILDESLVVPVTEQFSSTIGAVCNITNALKKLGTTAEQATGYYLVQNSSEWYKRLTDLVYGNAGGITFVEGQTAYSAGSCAASYLDGTYTGNGISAAFSGEWYPVNNFLQYGGSCFVGFNSSATPPSGFSDLDFQVIFQGGTSSGYITPVTTIVDAKANTEKPAIGVLYVPVGATSVANDITLFTTAYDKNYAVVYGTKVHFDVTGLNTITNGLAADVAGCIVRTDRDFYPWFSPAGAKRGRILNVVRLTKNLSTTEQDALYDADINPVVTFAGEGTILYGDKTGEGSSSTLSRINVSRLFMYIKRSLAPVARSILFEQNDSITRSRFKIAAEGFLDRIVAQRGIQEYQVICDTSNNTPEVIEANYFVADILIKPITSINYITITLTNKDLSSEF
jgi:hypothetical protein